MDGKVINPKDSYSEKIGSLGVEVFDMRLTLPLTGRKGAWSGAAESN
jgi:hypothetical protein